ncbi:aldo/keto reductase [Oscillatoria sp. CS-180]|uniref:aldo/keto reductase n=1 Tax=Oscillatoria sp. CS-180 TaxID=3021720 RepID=UPI0023313C64|nr:aldo/keto reductase [Oscillatoria sp. CS-180]MDB9529019.1 aldo/keto reductase [Oscillatoria sp. CS-180]
MDSQSHTEPQAIALTPEGPTIPALGVGTWAWGDSLFWSYGKEYTEADLQQAFKASVAAGVNFFDTAEIYGFGESERLIGRFLQQVNQPVFLATKYFPLPWRFSTKAVSETLTASLERLQLEAVELYQVHWPLDFFMKQKDLMNALANEVKQGRIRAVGVSNYSAQQMQEAHHYLSDRGVPLAVNQVQYSLLHRKVESNGVLDMARQLGVNILAYSPLAQGLLTGKYSTQNYQPPTGARKLDPRFSKQGLDKIELVLTTLNAIAQAHDKTPAQVALNWLICLGNVVPIPGAKNAHQARQNAGALGWRMTAEEHEQLGRVTRPWL